MRPNTYISKTAFIRLLLLSGNERNLRSFSDITEQEIQAEKDALKLQRGEVGGNVD